MQIGDENVNRCSVILDEVFGAENRVSLIQFPKTSMSSSSVLPNVGDFLLWYAKDVATLKFNRVYETLENIHDKLSFFSSYAMVEERDGTSRPLSRDERDDPKLIDKRGLKLFKRVSMFSQGWSTTGRSEPFTWQGKKWHVPPNNHWAISHEGLEELARNNRLVSAPDR